MWGRVNQYGGESKPLHKARPAGSLPATPAQIFEHKKGPFQPGGINAQTA